MMYSVIELKILKNEIVLVMINIQKRVFIIQLIAEKFGCGSIPGCTSRADCVAKFSENCWGNELYWISEDVNTTLTSSQVIVKYRSSYSDEPAYRCMKKTQDIVDTSFFGYDSI
eukprot:UN09647